jgi:hypothetical protein
MNKCNMNVDIYDKDLGDRRQQMVTPELVEKEINPRLGRSWTLSGKNKDGELVAVSQGQQMSYEKLEKKVEKLDIVDMTLRSPQVAG